MNLERWQALMRRFGLGEHRDTYGEVEAAYSQPHRHYHVVAHVASCLRELDEATDLARDPAEVEAALWFHDAVYLPRRQDNEARSAEWAVRFLATAGAPADRCDRVHQHIMATAHTAHAAISDDPDSVLVVDVDLTILGAPRAIYRSFEENIRREYCWVPALLFRRKRRQVLESFLERKRIYATDHFRDRFESSARENLRAAIDALA